MTMICWHCGETVKRKYILISSFEEEGPYPDDGIYFHYTCFAEVAGEEYLRPIIRVPDKIHGWIIPCSLCETRPAASPNHIFCTQCLVDSAKP